MSYVGNPKRAIVIDDPNLVDAEWVEEALRRAGILADRHVERIECGSLEGRAWSRMMRIAVYFQEISPDGQPLRLLLKLCSAEGGAFGPAEVDYYTRDYRGMPASPVPFCYDAVYQDSPRRYHLLLEDLSETHSNADACEPNESYGKALAEAVAALHAFRWGPERLGEIGGAMPERGDFLRYMEHVGRGLEPMIELAGDDMDTAWAPRLRLIFSRLVDRHTERASDHRGITRLHGDLNPGNILVPLDRSSPILRSSRIYLIDHQPFDWSLGCWVGASDFVYAMVLFWETDDRRRLEMSVLRRYHDSITTHGVGDYPFDLLVEDYRHCIVEAIAAAVEWCVLEEDRRRMPWLWTRHLRRALAAYDDLSCAEIWE